MANDIKITIPNELKKDLQKFGNQVAKNIAITVRDTLTQEYAYAVDQFYAAYTPTQYQRHWELRNSYKPYYRNPHGTRYHGGVEITADKMADVHSADNDFILSCALSGYHGQPSLGIYTPPWIYDHIENYRNSLFGFIEIIANDAIKKAKTESYTVLKFK